MISRLCLSFRCTNDSPFDRGRISTFAQHIVCGGPPTRETDVSGNVGPRFIDISIRNINWRLLVSRITLFRTHVTRNRDEFGFHCVTTAKWMQTEFELAHTHSLFPSICAHPSNRFPFSDLERLEIVFSAVQRILINKRVIECFSIAITNRSILTFSISKQNSFLAPNSIKLHGNNPL